jgi:hypothetical protein
LRSFGDFRQKGDFELRWNTEPVVKKEVLGKKMSQFGLDNVGYEEKRVKTATGKGK